ncbi:Hypothetical predicted protein [Paramuricea clavata]|uniref:Uncharacterized protein n=1 Tax=Paramuricea clavata TaxID=317549 RepID=A0A6S7IXI0_PARCT|nr:Hypothetical predicted protein [Paramuricea clavata]
MGAAPESYGSLLSSMLMPKLPPNLQLVVSRMVKENEWNLDKLLNTLQQELEARERIKKGSKSTTRCYSCKGRHYVSICKGKKPPPPSPRDLLEEHGQSGSNKSKESPSLGTHPDATVCHTTSSNCVLLQTARANIYNPDNPNAPKVKARLILDGGSQCSYVSSALTGTLGLQSKSQRSVNIKTFGFSETNAQVIDVQDLPSSRQPPPIADYSSGQHDAKVDIPIGSDHYWKIVTGKTRQGDSGPTAIQTRLGWVLYR